MVVTNKVIAPELKKFEREIKSASKGFLTVNMESDLPGISQPPVETNEDLDILYFPCCKETIKINRQQYHFCIICGVEIGMIVSDAKKVYLSHKSADKPIVVDYKGTLELLGFEPWLDEDAMPAGTTLERGLIQGMKDSCGAVFFITPSFEDEGYLKTEVDYAIQEKRRKGDKFAIITLLFECEEDGRASVPDLLRPYVWKQPRTQLEALREIVRALPVVVGKADWREETEGVAKTQSVNSTAPELSNEAKSILIEAAFGNGVVMHIRTLGGEGIQANSKGMIPNSDPRTVALWRGGLEDLQHRNYIRDCGHKGELFEVTREGYEEADRLNGQ
ncbi:MAG: toll/interleukin-1 receptor domain-containing protein [Gemmatimonadetes bacterium]|nr:toll/interleukin-1 receptor domain-containing protein [Gemmatimonadota bacterium]